MATKYKHGRTGVRRHRAPISPAALREALDQGRAQLKRERFAIAKEAFEAGRAVGFEDARLQVRALLPKRSSRATAIAPIREWVDANA